MTPEIKQLTNALRNCRNVLEKAINNGYFSHESSDEHDSRDEADSCVTEADEVLDRTDTRSQGYVARLIRDNAFAPADTIIRNIFKHFDYVRDDEDFHVFKDADECLEMWYGVDELRLVFDNKDGRDIRPRNKGICDHWVYLIHQNHHGKPHIEDLSDYTMDLDKTPLSPMLKEEYYDPHYRL